MMGYSQLITALKYFDEPMEKVNMSLLHYNLGSSNQSQQVLRDSEVDERYQREPLGDLKAGLDMIFELKAKLDKFHPIATETLIRLLSM